MKSNIRELALLSDLPCVIEGRLNYKKVYTGAYRNPAGMKILLFIYLFYYFYYINIVEGNNN